MSQKQSHSSAWTAPARLFGKLFVLGSPLLALMVAYAWLDPFRIIYHYDNFYDPPTNVVLNRDYVCTELFVQNVAQRQFDTLIFGSSRTLAYRVDDLRKVVGDDIHPFHFDAAEESLFGVHAKARLVHELVPRLRHVLIVVDANLLGKTTNEYGNHLRLKDPRLSGDSALAFQLTFLRAYFSGFFAPMYLHYRLIGHALPYMRALQEQFPAAMPENELTPVAWDTEIARDGIDAYVARRKGIFIPRAPATGAPVVGATSKRMLQETEGWLLASGARVEVVVSPLYDEVRLADADREALEDVFGQEHVHDYSGLNELTGDVTNYYETSHYRPTVGARILRQIYGDGRSAATVESHL